MNNSRVAYENIYEEPKPDYEAVEKRRSELTSIVEALKRVSSSDDWKDLKRLVLDGVVETLEKQLSREASKSELNSAELFRLQGQLAWARKYADLDKLAEFFRKQIEGIKLMTHEQETSGDGALTSS